MDSNIYYLGPTNYQGWSHILRRVALISRGISFLVGWNHFSPGYLFTANTSVKCDLGWCEIFIVSKISHILVEFDGRILTEGKSSGPPINVMPKEFLQESQWVVWPLKSKVGVVGDNMVDVALRSTLKRNMIRNVHLYDDPGIDFS